MDCIINVNNCINNCMYESMVMYWHQLNGACGAEQMAKVDENIVMVAFPQKGQKLRRLLTRTGK